jgi:hypothetical protein
MVMEEQSQRLMDAVVTDSKFITTRRRNNGVYWKYTNDGYKSTALALRARVLLLSFGNEFFDAVQQTALVRDLKTNGKRTYNSSSSLTT